MCEPDYVKADISNLRMPSKLHLHPVYLGIDGASNDSVRDPVGDGYKVALPHTTFLGFGQTRPASALPSRASTASVTRNTLIVLDAAQKLVLRLETVG